MIASHRIPTRRCRDRGMRYRQSARAVLLLLCMLLVAGCSRETAPRTTTSDPLVRERIVRTFEQASSGRASAQNRLGKAYAVGDGMARDAERASKWLRRAARQGHAVGQYNLYVLLSQVPDMANTEDEALNWLASSADLGLMQAQFRRAQLLRTGEMGMPRDMQRAAMFYERAARQGYAPAQYNLARLLETGRGVSSNDTAAFGWFKKAAAQGIVEAQITLAVKYERGLGVVADDRQALQWFRRAALQNSAIAQYDLSLMYLLGKGESRDPIRAYAWAELAAGQGLSVARGNVETLRGAFSRQHLLAADELVDKLQLRIKNRTRNNHRPNRYFGARMNEPLAESTRLE